MKVKKFCLIGAAIIVLAVIARGCVCQSLRRSAEVEAMGDAYEQNKSGAESPSFKDCVKGGVNASAVIDDSLVPLDGGNELYHGFPTTNEQEKVKFKKRRFGN